MEEERRTRESKLRGRLAKKRKAKEEEMQKAAISDRVTRIPSVVFTDVPVFRVTAIEVERKHTIVTPMAQGSGSMLYTHAFVVNRKKKQSENVSRMRKEPSNSVSRTRYDTRRFPSNGYPFNKSERLLHPVFLST